MFNRVWMAIAVPGTAARRVIVRVAQWVAYGLELLLKAIVSPISLLARSHRTLFVLYDANVNPITYDFTWNLAGAEVACRERGLDRIHVIIIPPARWRAWGESMEYNTLFNEGAVRWRFQNIVVSLCQLGPHVSSVSVVDSQVLARVLAAAFAWHTFPRRQTSLLPCRDGGRPFIFGRARGGGDTHVLRAPEAACRYVADWLVARKGGRRLITITLRRSAYGQARNSDLGAWFRFIHWLDAERYAVVLIPETDEAATFELPDDVPAHLFREAALDVRLRLALYSEAFLNMGVNNGPLALAIFAPVPLAMVKKVVETIPQASSEVLRAHGFEPGLQPPFLNRSQKIFWEHGDGFEDLCAAFAEMEARLDDSGGAVAAP